MTGHFDEAAQWIASQSSLQWTNETKLELYALYKIHTTASLQPTSARPGMFDFAGKAKYDTWVSKGKQLSSCTEAEQLYIDKVKSLGWEEGADIPPHAEEDDVASKTGQGQSWVRVSVMQPDAVEARSSGSLHDLATDGDLDALKQYPNIQNVVDQKDDYGYTALHLASDRGHGDIVSFLLSQGADCNILDGDGQTPLDLAQCMEHSEIIALLGNS